MDQSVDLVPRQAESLVTEALADTRVVTLNGARQTGKSTLARITARRHPTTVIRLLDDPATLRWMYQTVLREAARPEDLADYLNGDTLSAVWPDLFLPRGVRQAWEDRFPVLRAATPAAV